jgi:hypothetical protein
MGSRKFIDLTGFVFNRYTVIERDFSKKSRYARWICKCKCGNIRSIPTHSLKSGDAISCGCFRNEKLVERKTHGQSSLNGTPEYRTYFGMKARCYNENTENYPRYGGRGITVCNRWLESFENFFEDMGKKPSLNHSLDRINNDGNYEPGNCRWATKKEQSQNRANNRVLIYGDIKMTFTEWCVELNIKSSTLFNQLKRLSFKEIYEKIKNGKRNSYNPVLRQH